MALSSRPRKGREATIVSAVFGEDMVKTASQNPFIHDIERVLIKPQYTLLEIVRQDTRGKLKTPSLFVPRTDWPTGKSQPFALTEEMSTSKIYENLGSPTPMLRWNNRDWLALPSNQTVRPEQHLVDVNEFLMHLLSEELASLPGMLAMLKVATYGMEGIFAKLKTCLTVRLPKVQTQDIPKANGFCGYFPKGQRVIAGDHTGGFASAEEVFTEFTGRRFVVGLFNIGMGEDKLTKGNHWASFLFDRVEGQFYYFDSLDANRLERFEAAVVTWRMFLDRHEYPYKFTAICAPVTHQGNSWSSGYKSIFMLLLITRGFGGCWHDPAAIEIHSIPGLRNVSLKNVKLRVPLPDWHLWDQDTTSNIVVYGILSAICVNELGLTNKQVMNSKGSLVTLPMCDNYCLPGFIAPGTKVNESSLDLSLGMYSPVKLPPPTQSLVSGLYGAPTNIRHEMLRALPGLMCLVSNVAEVMTAPRVNMVSNWRGRGSQTMDRAKILLGDEEIPYRDYFDCPPPTPRESGDIIG